MYLWSAMFILKQFYLFPQKMPITVLSVSSSTLPQPSPAYLPTSAKQNTAASTLTGTEFSLAKNIFHAFNAYGCIAMCALDPWRFAAKIKSEPHPSVVT